MAVQVRELRRMGDALPINMNTYELYTLVRGLVLASAFRCEHLESISLARWMPWLAAHSARFSLEVGIALDVRALECVADLAR
eukprot:5983004-Pleurochrysis_carterae.AAC.2